MSIESQEIILDTQTTKELNLRIIALRDHPIIATQIKSSQAEDDTLAREDQEVGLLIGTNHIDETMYVIFHFYFDFTN